jgi:hypothetical protein
MVKKKAPCFPLLVFLNSFCRVPKEKKKRVGRKERRGKEKKWTRKGKDLYNNGRALFFVNFFFTTPGSSPVLGSTTKGVLHETNIKMPTSLVK